MQSLLDVDLKEGDLKELGIPMKLRRALLKALHEAEARSRTVVSVSFGEWLASAGAAAAEPTLRKGGFHGVSDLQKVGVTEKDLKDLGLPLKERRALFRALQTDETSCNDNSGGACPATSKQKNDIPVVYPPNIWDHALQRREGVKVGQQQRWPLEDGRTVVATTLSMQPLVFLLDGYLTATEADQVIEAARARKLNSGSGTFSSKVVQGTQHPADYRDFDGNAILDDRELLYAADHIIDGHFELEDVHALMHDLHMDTDGDGALSRAELYNGPDGQQVSQYLQALVERQPTKRSRTSELTWLRLVHAPVVHTLQHRMAAVMAVPNSVVTMSQKMQVVRYGTDGQYTAHLDSGAAPQPRTGKDGAMPCCHLASQAERKLTQAGGQNDLQMRPEHECRICRFATLLYNLNDVPTGCGGETVFPLANNANFSALDAAAAGLGSDMQPDSPSDARAKLSYAVNAWRVQSSAARESEYCRGGNNSADGNNGGLRIRPVKGQAILWYNHHVQATDSTLGDVDFLSLHGGCRIWAGPSPEGGQHCVWPETSESEKWIANHWIEASEELEADERVALSLSRH